MKTKALQIISLTLFCLLTLSFTDPYSIKRISDKEYRYEFFTTHKKTSIKLGKIYFWFKGGLIHKTNYGVSGELLDGNFTKFYHSNQLAEQGKFKKGLKKGVWKLWHENGNLSSIENYSSGLKNGKFVYFDANGELIEKGYYSNDKKIGAWINYIRKDTAHYRNGNIYIKTRKKTIQTEETKNESNVPIKKSFLNRLFNKNNNNAKST